MALTISGKVERIGSPVLIPTKSGNTFRKRELVLDCTRFDSSTGEPYENHPSFEFVGQKCELLDKIKAGQRVEVSFSLSGVKYEDKTTHETKYFTKVVGYNVQEVGNTTQEVASSQPSPTPVQEYEDTPF